MTPDTVLAVVSTFRWLRILSLLDEEASKVRQGPIKVGSALLLAFGVGFSHAYVSNVAESENLVLHSSRSTGGVRSASPLTDLFSPGMMNSDSVCGATASSCATTFEGLSLSLGRRTLLASSVGLHRAYDPEVLFHSGGNLMQTKRAVGKAVSAGLPAFVSAGAAASSSSSVASLVKSSSGDGLLGANVESVPEPSTILATLSSAGMIMFLGYRRRCRSKRAS